MSAGADEFATFVVRLSRGGGGRLSGIVERVKTGEKVRVHDLGALGAVIAAMLPTTGSPDATPTDGRGQDGERP